MTPVELYVYDLSNGLSRTMSLPLTGKQIDGIWHTSVVVYGREIYYGQGILTTRPPGTTHHGKPLQRLAMGDTGLDEETIDEYLDGLRDHYRADKYHLLDFNCNSFTADVVGFLTGGTIPSWISSLPADFLSTPFGAALRPQIDAMFNPNAQPNPSTSTTAPRPLPIPVSPSLDPSITSSLLSQVAARASASAPSSASSTPPPPTTLSSPLQLATSSASLHAVLKSSRAVVAFFTNPATCPPCRVVEPQFERLARERSRAGKARVGFVSVDLGVGRAGEIAAEWSITATPSFLFFLDGEKFDSLRGGNMRELESKLDMLLFQGFPPHKHSTLPLPVVQALSPSPICFTSAPAYPALLTKLISFIETNPKLTSAEMGESKAFFVKEVVPFLEKKPDAATAEALLPRWLEWTRRLFEALQEGEVFPLIDLWRMGVLDSRISSLCVISSSTTTPVSLVLDLLLPPSAPSKEVTAIARPLLITSIRLLTNAFSSLPLATLLLSPATTPSFSSTTITLSPRDRLTRVLVDVLLAQDASVRAAAAGLAFNVASFRHRRKSAYPPSEAPSEVVGADGDDEEEGDWTLELVIAIVEAIRLEDKSEDVVYRLTSALALALHMSPYHSSTLGPNLEVLDARATLERKAAEAWVKKRETRVLLAEVGSRLCA